MALINCSECGKEFSDRAASCPNCGCPTSIVLEELGINNTSETENYDDYSNTEESSASMPESDSVTDRVLNFFESSAQSVIESSQNTYRTTKKIGPIQVDELHSKFRINGKVLKNGKKDGVGMGVFKGMMAVSTLGMSVAAEKAMGLGKNKVGNKDWFDYSDLISYELLEDESVVTSGGVGRALIGGAIFGGAGAIAGGITGKRTAKKRIESLYIKVTLKSFDCPCIIIPLVTKPLKLNSKEYQNVFNEAHQILSMLDVISHSS